MTTDDFAEYNPRVASNSVAPLYALHEGDILQVSANAAEPVAGGLGDGGNIESADITADGVIAAVRREGDESRFIFGDIEGDIEEGLSAETISRPTFENAGQSAWTVVDGDEVMRVVRSPQTGELTTTRVITTDLEDRKSTRLNSSHVAISYAVFCLKKTTDSTSDRQTAGKI